MIYFLSHRCICLWLALLFIIIFFNNTFSQSEASEEQYKYFHGDVPNVTYSGQIGGLALPSEGNIHVLIIFVKFPDDNYTGNSSWPKGGSPWNMNQWVDQTWSQNPTPYSMTDYFNQMSF